MEVIRPSKKSLLPWEKRVGPERVLQPKRLVNRVGDARLNAMASSPAEAVNIFSELPLANT